MRIKSTWLRHEMSKCYWKKWCSQTCSYRVATNFQLVENSFFEGWSLVITFPSSPLCPSGSTDSVCSTPALIPIPLPLSWCCHLRHIQITGYDFSEKLLGLSTARRWVSRFPGRMHWTPPWWDLCLLSCHCSLTHPCATHARSTTRNPVPWAEGLVSHVWVFPHPAFSALNAFLFYPHDKLLVFKAHLRVSFLFSRLSLAALSVFLQHSWRNTSFEAFVEGLHFCVGAGSFFSLSP